MSERSKAKDDTLSDSGAKLEMLVCFSCAFIILIHLIASFFPHLRLWGINQLGYFSLRFRLGITAVGLLILIPQMNRILANVLASVFARVAAGFKKVNKYLIYSGFSLLSLIFFRLLRSKTPLLGDGYMRGNEIGLGKLYSITEFLDFHVHLAAFRFLGLDGFTTYAVLSCIAGAVGVFLMLLLADVWGRDGREKVLIFLILATMGSTQLFFGYVESYSFMYMALLAYILFGLRYLMRKSSFLWPALFFLLAVGFHLSALFVLPSLLYLALAELSQPVEPKVRRFKWANLIGLFGVISLMGVGFFLLRTSPAGKPRLSSIIHPFGGGESFYSFLSLTHILDFLNHQFLISPVSLVLFLVPLIFLRWSNIRENAVKFLLCLAVCSFGFALLIDPKLGYARDWDLFAGVGLGIVSAGLYLTLNVFRNLSQKMQLKDLNRVTLILVVTSLFSTLPWIMVNGSEEKAVARFKDILRIDERRAPTGYETLACYFRDKGEDERTVELWKDAIAINPTPRYFGALGNAYRRLNEYDKAIEAYDRSLRMAARFPGRAGVHKNLGNTLARVGRYEEAIFHLKQAIDLQPGRGELYDNLGKLLGDMGRYEEAIPCFEKALKLDPGNVTANKALGICYAATGRKKEAQRYLKIYLESKPQDAARIEEMMDSIKIGIKQGR
jgi:Tfp pilus assembly protein PilF